MADTRFQTGFEAHTLGRDNAIGPAGPRKKRKKKSKNDKKKRRGKKTKQEEKKVDEEDIIGMSDPMRKLRSAHPRHIIKLILRKLCEKPSFYRMLGTLGIALKASGVSLEEYLLSNSNKLSRLLRNKLRYDINDMRVLILSRILIHKMLIKEGTTLKSCIHSSGTYPEEYDSDDDDMQIQQIETQYKNLKKGLKYINNQQFVDKMQNENPQEILNALAFKDKHRLYELLKADLDTIDEKDGGASELHKVCTYHVSNPPELTLNAMPTIIKHDDQNTWPEIHEPIDPNTFMLDDDIDTNNLHANGMVIMDDAHELKDNIIDAPRHEVVDSVGNALGIPAMDDIKMQVSTKSNFTAPSARSIYEDDYKEEEKQSMPIDMASSKQLLQSQHSSRQTLLADNSASALPAIPMDDPSQMTEAQKQEFAAEQAKDKMVQMKKEYATLIEKSDKQINDSVKNRDHDKMMSHTYEYSDDYKVNPHKDISLLSSLQTQVDILVRYNHIGYKHLSMLLTNKPSCLPEMYVSLEKMREWELQRENEIEILDNKTLECKVEYGKKIEELNIRKALLAREINESKVSLERIRYELQKMRKLYEHAKLELDEVNETTKQQELQRDDYLTKFDEKWTFEWAVRKKFHKQAKLNEAVKSDARDWVHKLDQIKRYDTSQEVWQNLKEEIWRFYHDNKKIGEHYLKLTKVNKSRETMYFGCINFWNLWYYRHTSDGGGEGLNHMEDKKKLDDFYKNVMLKGTNKNLYFEFNKDMAQFEYELSEIAKKSGIKPDIWSYREHVYDLKEQQIDIQQTELGTNELWKLVEYQEKNDMESYKQYAYPKLYKFEQEQLELDRRERIKEIEKQTQRESSKPSRGKGTSKRKLLKLKQKQKMNELREEDEERDMEEERKYQSQMQFINQSTSHIAFSNSSLPGTPGTGTGFSARMGLNSMGMSGRGDQTFTFGRGDGNGNGTMNNFGGMGMSNKAGMGMGMSNKAGAGSFNFGGSKGGFVGMSGTSIGMDSRQGSISAFAPVGGRSDFGRQRTSNTYGYGNGNGTPTYSKYSGYGGTPTAGGYGNSTPTAGAFGTMNPMSKRYSDISASGFGNNTPKIQKPRTPNNDSTHSSAISKQNMGLSGLSGMGGSFNKFQPMNFGMDSPSTQPIQSNNNDMSAGFDLIGQNSFSMVQKHETGQNSFSMAQKHENGQNSFSMAQKHERL